MNKSEEERQKYTEELKTWAWLYKRGNAGAIIGDAPVPLPYCYNRPFNHPAEYVVQLLLYRRYQGDPYGATRGLYDESRSILAFDPRAFTEEQK